MTVLTGIIYPVFLTGIAQVVFPDKVQRQPDNQKWNNYWIQPDWTKIRQYCLFLVTTLGC